MVAYINRRICIYWKTHIHAYIYPFRIFIFFIGGVFFIRGQDYLNTFFFKNRVFRILLEIFMGFSNPKGGKKTRSIRIRDRYIFNIFLPSTPTQPNPTKSHICVFLLKWYVFNWIRAYLRCVKPEGGNQAPSTRMRRRCLFNTFSTSIFIDAAIYS